MSGWRFGLQAAFVLAAASVAAAAGDVALEVDENRTLRLTGDAFANSVEVAPGPTKGTVRVTGLDGTTIGGEPERVLPQPRGLRADLGDGDDRIEVRQLTWKRDLRIKGEGGGDSTVLRGVVVQGRTSWIGGRGEDRLDVDGSCVFRRAVKLEGREARDVITVKGSRILGQVRVRGNKGDDDVIFRRMAFAENARVDIDTGNGADLVTFDTCTTKRLVIIDTGRHEDFVRVTDSHANATFRIAAGRADDRVNLDDTTFNKDVRLDGDSGKDTLDMDGRVRFRGVDKHPHKYELKLYSFERRR
jgi:hypothetical protein